MSDSTPWGGHGGFGAKPKHTTHQLGTIERESSGNRLWRATCTCGWSCVAHKSAAAAAILDGHMFAASAAK